MRSRSRVRGAPLVFVSVRCCSDGATSLSSAGAVVGRGGGTIWEMGWYISGAELPRVALGLRWTSADPSWDASMDGSYGGGGFDVADVDRGRLGRVSSGLTTLNFFSFAAIGALSWDECADVPEVVWASTEDVLVVEEAEEWEDAEGA